jgi:hypothetical protein
LKKYWVIAITNKKFLAASLLALMLLMLFFSAAPTIGQTDDVSLKMQNANDAIGQAFNGLLSAEKAGANVTGLLDQLNVATGILAQAENSYRNGDTSASANYADQAIPIAQQVTAQATTEEETAAVASQQAFELTIIFVVIGSFLFIVGLFLVWRLFKKRYINNLLESKQKVADN